MTEVERATCSCGGEAREVEPSDDENSRLGWCGRQGCCVRALRCLRCATRMAFKVAAPEADADRD